MPADNRHSVPLDHDQPATERLRITESRLDILMENLPSGILFENEGRQVVYVNHNFCALFDCPSPADLAGSKWDAVEARLRKLVAPSDLAALNELTASHQPVEKHDLPLNDGRILECDCTPVLDGADEIGTLWQFRDVTIERKAEQQQQRDQAILDEIVTNVPVRLFAADRDNRMVKAWGPNWFDIKNEELEGNSLLDYVSAESAQQIRERSRIVMSGTAQQYEVDINGVIVTASVVPRRNEQNEIIGMLGVTLNVTEAAQDRDQLIRQHDFLALMTDAAMTLIQRRDIHELLQQIVVAAAQVVGSRHGFIYMIEPDHRTMKMQVACGLFQEFIGFEVRKGEGMGGIVWLEGQSERVDNYDEWELRSGHFPKGIAYAAVGVPLWSEAKVVGMVGVSHDTPEHKMTEQDLEQIKQFAHLAGLILENARLYDAAQSSRDRYQATIETIGDGYFETNETGRFRYVNSAFERLLGYTKTELIGTPLAAYAALDEQSLVASFSQEIFETGEAERALNFTIMGKDGLARQVELSVSPLKAEADSCSIGLQGIMRDHTEWHKMQDQMLASQNQYYALVEAMGGGVLIQNADGQITICNEVARNILGVSREDVVAARLDQLDLFVINEACQMVAVEELPPEVVLRAGQPQKNVVLRIIDEGNWSETWVAVNAEPILYAADGPVQGVVSSLTDITQTKRLEQIARQRALELRHFQDMNTQLMKCFTVADVAQAALEIAISLSDASAGFFALQEDNHLYMYAAVGAYRTHALHRRMPIPRHGVVKRVLDSRMAEWVTDVSQDEDFVASIAHTRSQIVIPLLSRDREPGIVNLETHDSQRFTPEKFDLLKLLASRIAAALDNVRLVEHKARQQAELRLAEARVQELEQFQTEMSRVFSHELRNPLAVIQTYLALLADDLADRAESFAPYFSETRRALNRLQNMTTDFLALAQAQAAQTGEFEFVKLAQVVECAFLDHRAAADDHHLTYQLDLGDSEQICISGEPLQLQQAISSLISNAIKFTPPEGQVCVRLRQARDCIIFEVEDTGCGVAPADQDKLFQPFFRIRAEETRHIDGVGLGLYLVKQIVHWHQGKLIVRSQPGAGSTFGFELSLLVQ